MTMVMWRRPKEGSATPSGVSDYAPHPFLGATIRVLLDPLPYRQPGTSLSINRCASTNRSDGWQPNAPAKLSMESMDTFTFPLSTPERKALPIFALSANAS